MDKDINRYSDFCRRLLNKYGYSSQRLTPAIYYIVEQLERIGDSYRDICNHIIKNKIQPGKESPEIAVNVAECF